MENGWIRCLKYVLQPFETYFFFISTLPLKLNIFLAILGYGDACVVTMASSKHQLGFQLFWCRWFDIPGDYLFSHVMIVNVNVFCLAVIDFILWIGDCRLIIGKDENGSEFNVKIVSQLIEPYTFSWCERSCNDLDSINDLLTRFAF